MNTDLVEVKPHSKKYILTEKGFDFLRQKLDEGLSYTKLSKIYNVNPDTLSILAKEYGISKDNRRRYTLKENYFSKIDTKEKAYWLGFLAADGYVDEDRGIVSVGLQSSDKEHIQKFLNAIGSNKEIKETHFYFNNKDHSGWAVTVNSVKMTKDLQFLGLYKNKSLTLEPPSSEQVPRCFVKYWILGYFDGDGCLSFFQDKSRNTTRYKMGFLGTKNIINYIQDFLSTNKTVHLAHNCKEIYQINFTETDTRAILDYLYEDFDTSICLERKYQKYLQILELNRTKPKRKRKQKCLIPY